MSRSSFSRWGLAQVLVLVLALLLVSGVIQTVLAQEDPTTEADATDKIIGARTASDPEIALERLQLMLVPMTTDELAVEAGAWFELLRAKVGELSAAELAAADGTVDTTRIVLLETEEAALAERLGEVLDAMEEKGGEVESYRLYVTSVAGLELDVNDTSRLGLRAWHWLIAEDGGRKWAVNSVKFIIILLVSIWLFRFLADRLEALLAHSKSLSAIIRQFIVVTVRRSGLVIGALLSLAAIDVSLGPIFAVVGAASFVLAFALQSNLANLASGMMLMINRPFDVGDEVKVAGHWAYVDSITLSNTVLKGFDGSIITLPNNKVWGGDIINFTHSDTRKLVIAIRIRFSEDIGRITELWNGLAGSIPVLLKDPAPGIFAYAGSPIDHNVPVSLIAWAKTDEYWDAYTQVLKGLQRLAEEHGIEFSAEAQEVHLVQPGPLVPARS